MDGAGLDPLGSRSAERPTLARDTVLVGEGRAREHGAPALYHSEVHDLPGDAFPFRVFDPHDQRLGELRPCGAGLAVA
jgi:hypothetical protein